MSYICEICGLEFDEPLRIKRAERYGEFILHPTTEICPACNLPYFSKAEPCTCGGLRLEEDILCRKCRGELLKRVNEFFDELTAEEEEQFDSWMDGSSIEHRKNWEGRTT